MEYKIEDTSISAPNVSNFKYEFWKNDSFWGSTSYYVKIINRSGNSIKQTISEEDWKAIRNACQMINDLFKYKVTKTVLDNINTQEFQEIAKSLYGLDLASIKYDHYSSHGTFYYKKTNIHNYPIEYRGNILYGYSVNCEPNQLSIIAKDGYHGTSQIISFNSLHDYMSLLRTYWSLALWKTAEFNNIANSRYFVFQNTNSILDSKINNCLNTYNLIISFNDNDWI